MSNNKKYTVEYSCNNCEYKGPHEINFGEKAPETITCKNCGCNTAKRKRKSDEVFPRGSKLPPKFPEPWEYPYPRIPKNIYLKEELTENV